MDAVPELPPGRRRAWLIQTALLVVLMGAVALAVDGLIPGSGTRLDNLAPGWIVAGVAVELLAIGAYVAQFHDAFVDRAHPEQLPLARSAQIAVGELGAFVVVPTGAGGPALRIWSLLRSGMALERVMRRIVIQTIIFNLPYLATALALGVVVAFGIGPSHAPLAVALAPLAVAAVAIAFVVAMIVLAARQQGSPGPRGGVQRVGWQFVQAVPQGVRALPKALRRPVLVLGAAAYWAGDCVVLVLAFHAVHGSAPIAVIVPAYMLGQLGNALPLPGGVGGVEPIMLGVLTSSGVGAGLGGAAIVLYRLISLGIQVGGGTLAVALLFRALGGAGEPRGSRTGPDAGSVDAVAQPGALPNA